MRRFVAEENLLAALVTAMTLRDEDDAASRIAANGRGY
jgi:hypothetical protein